MMNAIIAENNFYFFSCKITQPPYSHEPQFKRQSFLFDMCGKGEYNMHHFSVTWYE